MVIIKNNYLNFNAILLITFINSSLYRIYNQFNNIKLEAVYNYTTFTNIFVFGLGLYSLKNIVNLYIKTKKNYFIEKDINEDIQEKLSESLYSFIYHTVSVIIMYYNINNSEWYVNNDVLYINLEYKNIEGIDRELNLNEKNFYILTIKKMRDKNINRLIEYLKNENIETRPMFYPLSDMKVFKKYHKGGDANSKKWSYCSLSLPTYPGLKIYQIKFVSKKIIEFLLEN